jgi:hypothetical protein
MIRSSQQHHFNSVLEEDDCDDVDDVLLIQHIRETGDILHADALGSGEQHIGGWYNPAPMQRMRAQRERQRVLDRERAIRERRQEEDRRREWVRAEAEARAEYEAEQAKAQEARDAAYRAAGGGYTTAYVYAQERHNLESGYRSKLERKCWDIAQEAAAHWQASEGDAKLMWNMMRYMNLGAGRGRQWDAQRFAADTFVPIEHVTHCYKLLRERHR